MQEIKCPKCGEVFQVDESGYAAIVKQVRDTEFQKDISERTSILNAEKEAAIKLAVSELTAKKDKQIAELCSAIETLQSERESAVKLAISEISAKKDRQILELSSAIESLKSEKDTAVKLAVSEITAQKDRQIAEVNADIATLKSEAKLVIEKLESIKDKEIAAKDLEISKLKSDLSLSNNSLALEIKNAVQQKEVEILNLQNQAKLIQSAWELKEKTLSEKFNEQIRLLNEQVAYYKDFKAKQSTKMLGESLEQHCEIEFNRIRATAFPGAYFEKDNDARTGSKGDYIYREFTEDGIEVLSIMFEMKNESDATASKKKNEDFFKELDKDRREKGCQYAILVSMLESDSEYYNTGIVDVSHKYKKMYVIRPQFFIPVISFLRNEAQNSVEYKRELELTRRQNIDITHFEDSINDFKEKFGRNYRLASDWMKRAVAEIEKCIDHLQKVKDAILSSENNFRLANNKAEDLTIKRLVANNPTMAAMFEELKEAN